MSKSKEDREGDFVQGQIASIARMFAVQYYITVREKGVLKETIIDLKKGNPKCPNEAEPEAILGWDYQRERLAELLFAAQGAGEFPSQ